MNATCHSQPISHLRLERHLQGDTAPLERARIGLHLRGCEACRACFEELRLDRVELLPLPRPLHSPSRSKLRWPWPPLTAALAVAAALALWLRPVHEDSAQRARVAIKGGELALTLVREHAAQLAREATRFVPGDRFEARISCPPGRRHWQLVVRQAGESYFPLAASEPIACGNNLTLPGAFSLDGTADALVCVALSDSGPVSQVALMRDPLPASIACVKVEAAAH